MLAQETAGESLGPLEDRKAQHNEEQWSFPMVNGRYVAKFLILFLKKKNTYHHGYTQTRGTSWDHNPTVLNKLLSLDLFLKQE